MSILKGLVAGTTTAVRNRLENQKAEREAEFNLLEQTAKENIEALKLKKTAVTRYDNVLVKVAEDIVADKVIDPATGEIVSKEVAYDMAYDLDQNFLNQTNDNGYATTNYKDLLNVYKQSNLNGNSVYVLNDGGLKRNPETEPEPKEIPGDDRNMFQKIFKNDPNYAAEQVGRKYGVAPGEAIALGGSQENALNMYSIADVYKGDKRRFTGRDLSGSGVGFQSASNVFAETIQLETADFDEYFSKNAQGKIYITNFAPKWFATAINAGTSVIGSVADNSGQNKVMVGPTVDYASEVSGILIDYQELETGLKALGKDIQNKYKLLLNKTEGFSGTSATIRADIVKKLDTEIKKNNVTERVKKRILSAYDQSLIDGDEFTELSTLAIDPQNVLKDIKELRFTKYAINQAIANGVKEETTEVKPKEKETKEEETKEKETEVELFTKEQLESAEAIRRGQAQDLMNKIFSTENFNEIASSMENNPFLENFNVSPEESNNDSAKEPTIGNRVDDAIETVSSGVEKIISARDAKVAASRIKTLNRNIKVQIAQGNTEKALELIDEANILARDVKGIFSTEEYKNITELAASLKPTEVAARYQGGFMTPRLNTGGTIDNITVTGTRSNPFDFGSNPFGVRRGSIYNDGTFDADIKGSSMMEDDAGYDEAYDYADRMRKQAKENITEQASDVFTDTSFIAKPSFIDKAKDKILEYAGEEIDKTTDITKTVVNLKNPLYLGTKATTGLITGTVNILNLFGKNLGISEGKLSADKFNTAISKPNNYVTGIIHGTIDRGADAAKEIIGATDSEDQG